jgi:hypothetical protein
MIIRDSNQGANGAVLVTTGTLTTTARRRVDELDVTVLDREAVLEAVVSAGLGDRLL